MSCCASWTMRSRLPRARRRWSRSAPWSNRGPAASRPGWNGSAAGTPADALAILLRRRQAQGDGGADIHLALEPEAPARLLDQGLHDRQAEAGALLAPRMRIVGLAERLQHLGDVLGRDPDAAIGDGELHLIAVLARREQHAAALRRELHRI